MNDSTETALVTLIATHAEARRRFESMEASGLTLKDCEYVEADREAERIAAVMAGTPARTMEEMGAKAAAVVDYFGRMPDASALDSLAESEAAIIGSLLADAAALLCPAPICRP